MDTLWNCMASVIPTTTGIEPGAVEKSIFPSFSSMEFSIPSLDTIKSKSADFSFKSLRNVMLQSFNEFNNGYFFLIVQLALLVYCPTVALSIMYEPQDQDFIIDKQSIDDEQQLAQTQQQFIQQFYRFIQQMLQSIAQNSQSQTQFSIQSIQEQQFIQCNNEQQCMSGSGMFQQQQQLRVFVRLSKEAKSTQNNNESGGVRVRVSVTGQRQGRQTVRAGQNGQVWQTVIIMF